MTAHEPYVADPAEPPRRPALADAGPLIALVAVIVVVASVALLLFVRGASQDPALDERSQPPAGGPADTGER